MAGLGVRRGRLPGATHDGWPGTAQDCDPRAEGQNPRPGITGLSHETSLGVADMALPWRSTTQTYEVSPGSAGLASARAAADGGTLAAGTDRSNPGTSPAGGISAHARSGRARRRRSAA